MYILVPIRRDGNISHLFISKGQRYTLLLDGGLMVGLKGQLAPHCVPWLKNSIMAYKLSTSLGSKTLNNTSSLGSGGNQNLRPSCRRPPIRTFHTPVDTLRLDAPALVWVRSPNDGNKLGWSYLSPLSTLPVLRVLFRCNLFDVSSVFWLFFQANLIIILIDPV